MTVENINKMFAEYFHVTLWEHNLKNFFIFTELYLNNFSYEVKPFSFLIIAVVLGEGVSDSDSPGCVVGSSSGKG